MKVKRYECYPMDEDACGNYVKFEDYEALAAQLTAAEQRAAEAEKDAERWERVSALMFIGNVELTQGEDGGYWIEVDPVENILGQSWFGNSPEEAVDAIASNQTKEQ